jgi:glycosyltransferase involved in cell wall biosynthesis
VKVSFVVPGYARDPIGGVGVVYQYANGLVTRGHEVTVVHAARYRRFPRLLDGRPRGQLEQLVSGWRDLRRGPPVAVGWLRVDPRVELRYVATISPHSVPDGDAVVATAWQTADPVAALPARKGLGAYLIQHHETWSGRASRVDATWRLPLRTIVIARWIEARARAMGLTDVHRLPGAIDTRKFHVAQPVDARPRRIAMLASEWPWKGRDDGVAALERVRSVVPDVAAVLFGAGPRPNNLPAWIDYRQDPPQAALVREIYNGSSIYLCPSHAEGWHLPPAEAMACGTAVVTTAIDGVADYAIDGETALLSPVRDPEGLAANLVRLLTDEPLRVSLARTGHRHIQQFTWPASTAVLESVLAAPDRAVAEPVRP